MFWCLVCHTIEGGGWGSSGLQILKKNRRGGILFLNKGLGSCLPRFRLFRENLLSVLYRLLCMSGLYCLMSRGILLAESSVILFFLVSDFRKKVEYFNNNTPLSLIGVGRGNPYWHLQPFQVFLRVFRKAVGYEIRISIRDAEATGYAGSSAW